MIRFIVVIQVANSRFCANAWFTGWPIGLGSCVCHVASLAPFQPIDTPIVLCKSFGVLRHSCPGIPIESYMGPDILILTFLAYRLATGRCGAELVRPKIFSALTRWVVGGLSVGCKWFYVGLSVSLSGA